MRRCSFILPVIAGASASAVAAQYDAKANAPFLQMWEKPIVPYAARRIVAGKHIPDLHELHDAIRTAKVTPADRERERSILDDMNRAGIGSSTYTHRNVTCRSNLCEYIIIFRKSISLQQEALITEKLSKLDNDHCKRDKCYQSAVLTGGVDKEDGVAVLTYFIPMGSRFL
jgi:hypothetical protein